MVKRNEHRTYSERREKRRYVVSVELDYVVLVHSEVRTGTGQVLDISSDSIRFHTKDAAPLGQLINLSVRWPVKAENGEPLTLKLWGQVLRRAGREVVVRFRRHAIQPQTQIAGAAGLEPNWHLERAAFGPLRRHGHVMQAESGG
jgi:hypothetical protein